jgi:ABC-type dipeptide/oligopeptide/nickel transport system permease subunit
VLVFAVVINLIILIGVVLLSDRKKAPSEQPAAPGASLKLSQPAQSAATASDAVPQLAAPSPKPAKASLNLHNYPLLIGATISLFFVFITFFGPSLAPKDPMAVSGRIEVDGVAYQRPYRPFTPGYPLGSDEIGRDVLSRLLHAVRPTLTIAAGVVLVRLALGVPLGLLAGWYKGHLERLVDFLVSTSLAVPGLIFCIAVIGFLGIDRGPIVFVVALCLTGWADITIYVKNQTLSLLKAPFIESAQAVGVKNINILSRYVLPQLWPILPALIAFELSAVILLIAELGFLGFFIGGGQTFTRPKGDTLDNWVILTSGYPELGQLIADVWAKMVQIPWLLFLVSVTILLLVFGFNMLGEGLRRSMDITRPRRRGWLGSLWRKWRTG